MRTLILTIFSFKKKETIQFETEEFFRLASSLSVLKLITSQNIKVSKYNSGYLIPSGSLQKISEIIKSEKLTLVLVNVNLSPIQQRNLEKFWNAKVLDRTGLVLEIFGSRALTKEGVLQVELAHLLHQKSRLVRSWTHLERQRGGKGFLGGPGETQIESDRRVLDARISSIKSSIEKVSKTRLVQRNSRFRKNAFVISFVGYTNAGKSTLFNSFPNKKTREEDRLFSTLDPFLKRCRGKNSNYVISDTVGFIQNLPTSLITAFKSTLEEIKYSQLIVHVIDASDEHSFYKSQVVYEVLETIDNKIDLKNKVIEVHNKIDLVDSYSPKPFNSMISKGNVFQVSAKNNHGIRELKSGIESILFSDVIDENIHVSSNEVEKLDWLYSRQLVVSANPVGKKIQIKVSWSKFQKEQFKKSFLVLAL